MAKKQKNIKKLTTCIVLILVALIALAINHIFSGDSGSLMEFFGLRDNSSVQSGVMSVEFIDVGQGDCTLIRCADKVLLVDGGESGEADNVINHLKNRNISRLDCVIATHPHSDHIGSLDEVISEFNVVDVIMPDIPEDLIPTTKTYENFLETLSDNAENIIPAIAGESISYGEITIEILGPVKEYDDLNNMSVVCRVIYGDTAVMLTGDAETPSEKDILASGADCSADLLKAGHHGSKTSTCDNWLKAVNPEFAVISCGLNNDYGHPHKQLVNRLNKFEVEYYRTDLLGTIVFESDGKRFTLIESES